MDDEAPAMEQLCYGKDELKNSSDVVQEDDLETTPNDAPSVTYPENDQDYLADLRMESMRLGEKPMKPERRTFLNEYDDENVPEEPSEDYLTTQNRKRYSYEEDSLSEDPEKCGTFRKMHSPIEEPQILDYQNEEGLFSSGDVVRNGNDEDMDKFPLEGEKRNRHDFVAYDYDKFNSSFTNNNNNSDNDNETKGYDNDGTKMVDSSPIAVPPRTTLPNDDTNDYHNRFTKRNEYFELTSSKDDALMTGTNGRHHGFDIGNNVENVSPKERTPEDSLKKRDDIGKISSKLEAFSKNIEMSSSPAKSPRPKIEDTEMPSKGVVSNLKSLFENNAVHNNHDAYKSANYKLEYGVGRSSGTLNKGVFH